MKRRSDGGFVFGVFVRSRACRLWPRSAGDGRLVRGVVRLKFAWVVAADELARAFGPWPASRPRQLVGRHHPRKLQVLIEADLEKEGDESETRDKKMCMIDGDAD